MTTEEQAAPERRAVHCKDYHRPKTSANAGNLRDRYQRKSTCPTWASSEELQQALIDEALEDSLGRPKTLWNAVDGRIFVGVSCNLREPRYNCYPEAPPDGKLFNELQRRAERTPDDLLGRAGGR
jgi:hypothetical protein